MKQITNVIGSILHKILFIILLVILGVNLWNLISINALGETNPTIGGYSQAIVVSGSMEPELSIGDLAIYKEVESYDVGDVVIYVQDNMLITHRIVEQLEDGFVTKGDANNVEDSELVNQEDIYGKLVGVIPNVGTFLTFVQTPLGMFLLIIVGLLFIEGQRIGVKNKWETKGGLEMANIL